MSIRDTNPESPAVTYGSYLQIDHLLSLQQSRSAGPEHDEMLFIIIHQVYELWFKEVLHELDRAMQLLTTDDAHRAVGDTELPVGPTFRSGVGGLARC